MKPKTFIILIGIAVLVYALIFAILNVIYEPSVLPEEKIIPTVENKPQEIEIIKSTSNLLDSRGNEIQKNIESSTEVFDKAYGLTGMEIKEFSIDNIKTDKLNYEDTNKEVRTEFKMLPYSAVEQDIYITNNLDSEKNFDYSTLIEIDYNEIRWNGTAHKLTSVPFKMTSWSKVNAMGDTDFIVPQVWFDNTYNKRIDYTDIARKGGYALAYEKDNKYYVELRIDNLNIKSKERYHIDPVFFNDTDGFAMNIAGALAGTPRGVGANATNVFVADGDVALLKYRRNAGTGAWENASGNCALPAEITGTTVLPVYDSGDGSFWMVNGYQYVHHINNACANQTGYFNTVAVTGLGSIASAANNGTAELWFGTYSTTTDKGRLAHTIAGVNQTDGFNVNVVTGHVGAGEGIYAITMNESDFWVMWYEDTAKGYVNHIDENHNNMSDGFNASALTGGSAWEGGMTTNGTDIFLAEYTNQFVYHLDPNITAYATVPTVTLNYPANATNTTIFEQKFNCSAITSLMNITNISFYHNDSGAWAVNQTVVRGLYTSDSYEFSLNFSTNRSILWNCYVCNNNTPATECAYSSYNNSFNLRKWIVNAENYSQTTIEGASETFNINVSIANISLSYATLNYNNTFYNGSLSHTGYNYTAVKIVSIPDISLQTNLTFNWTFYLADGTSFSSESHNQTVSNMTLDDCTTNTITIVNYTLVDEDNQTMLGGTGFNTQIEIDLDIYSKGTGDVIASFSNTSSKVNPTRVCINNPLSNTQYELYSSVVYSSNDRAIEHHYLQNYTLTNTTTHQNITLYDLNSSKSTSFLVSYQDSNFLPVSDALINIQREYTGEGVFKSVEIGKTDSDGQAVLHMIRDDVVYTIVVSKYGQTLDTFSNIVAWCDDAVIGNCKINLNQFGEGTDTREWRDYKNLNYDLNFNKNARTITLTFNTVDGGTETVSLNATKFDMWDNETVCSDSLTTSSGTLTCTIPASYGNVTVSYSIFVEGMSIINQGFWGIDPDRADMFDGTTIIFLLIMVVSIPLMFITNTIGMVIGALLSILAAGAMMLYSGSLIGSSSAFLWIVVASIILIWKISERSKS
jgi:hypothetical protein